MRNIFFNKRKLFFLSLTIISLGVGLFLFINSSKSVLKSNNVSTNDSEAIPEDGDERDEISSSSPTPSNDNDVMSYSDNVERVSARVVRVRDGDTIEVDLGMGDIKVVRYIGIDTPESVDPRRSVECFGKEASNMNNSLVGGKIVQLEKDVSETDKYGRLLRYVHIDGLFVNQYLVEEGFANASPYPPDVKYQEDLGSAEGQARLDNKGLWGSCPSTSGSSSSSISNSSRGDKDCSDFSTHQEAQDYFNSKGGSATNNVDKLDGSDHDGVVCETLP